MYGPYHDPVTGRDAIVANWLKHKDKPNTYEAHYKCIATGDHLAVANGRSTYYEVGTTTLRTQYDNIFVIHFNDEGRCTHFTEWFMEKPKDKK